MTPGLGAMRTSATSPRRTWPPAGVSISKLTDAREAVADLRRAPDDDVEDLLLLEQAADDEAREQRRRGAADVAGLDSVPVRLGEIDPDLDRRLLGRRRTRGVAIPSTRTRPAAPSPPALQGRQILAVDANDDVLVRFPSGRRSPGPASTSATCCERPG